MMKRQVLTMLAALAVTTNVWAAEPMATVADAGATVTAAIQPVEDVKPLPMLANYKLLVDDKEIRLPTGVAPAVQGEKDILVPLRAVSEALGYTVSWNDKAKAARISMSVAAMNFPLHEKTYEREGKLQIINFDGKFPMDDAPYIIDGVMYVPATIFKAFLNDVTVDPKKHRVNIDVQKAYIQQASQQLAALTDAAHGAEKVATVAEDTGVSMPNPIIEYRQKVNMDSALGYTTPTPTALADKKVKNYALIDRELAETFYADGSLYRVKKGTGDISGDYNGYKEDITWAVGDTMVRARGNGDGYQLITWEHNGMTHSYYSATPMTAEQVDAIVQEYTI